MPLPIKFYTKQDEAIRMLLEPAPKELWDEDVDVVPPYLESLGFGGAAGPGKTMVGLAWGWLLCMNFDGVRFVVARKEYEDLRGRTLDSYFKLMNIYNIDRDWWGKYNFNDKKIYFPNGSQIVLQKLPYHPSDPLCLYLGGLEGTAGFIDESNEVKWPAVDIFYSRMGRHLNMEYRIAPRVLETFNPDKGHVHRRFISEDISNNPSVSFIKSLATDRLRHPEYFIKHRVLHKEDRGSSGGIYVAGLMKRDEVTRERLLWGNFDYDDDPRRMLEIQDIRQMFIDPVKKVGDLEVFISVDVARLGRDKTVIMAWAGLHVIDIMTIDKSDIQYVVDSVRAMEQKHKAKRKNIIVDVNGLGGGVVDHRDLKGCIGFDNNSKSIDTSKRAPRRHSKVRVASPQYVPKWNNLKSQCAFKLAELVKSGEVRVNASPDQQDMITQELEAVRQDMRSTEKEAKMAIESKDKMKSSLGRSPDYFDAMLMRMYYELRPKIKSDAYFEVM